VWLKQNVHELDRVMHSDSYDVFFQADPFQDLVPHDRLLLVVEDFAIYMCDWNSLWICECYGNDTWHEIRMHNIICTGIICGNADAYLRILKVMIKRPEWKHCWMPSKDQPIFNNLLWTGVFEYHGFRFNYTNYFNGIFTMHWCQGKINCDGTRTDSSSHPTATSPSSCTSTTDTRKRSTSSPLDVE
jgi:hypothetical protein